MRNWFFSIFLILAISGESPAHAAEDVCAQNLSQGLKAAEAHRVANRNLLALVELASLRYLPCAGNFRAEIAYRSAESLLALGEKAAARETLLELIAAQGSSETGWKARALITMNLDLNTPTALSPALRARLSVWNARRDEGALSAAFSDPALRFTPQERASLSALTKQYDLLPHRSPVLAGIFSAVVPGAGQAYSGNYQSGGTAFALNALFLFSTIQLAKKKLGFPAAVTGVAFSTVYLGNIIAAVTGAKKFNEGFVEARDREYRRALFDPAIN